MAGFELNISKTNSNNVVEKVTGKELINSDILTADKKLIRLDKVEQNALLDIVLLPRILKGVMEKFCSTPSVFNSYYKLKHDTLPFKGGTNIKSETSVKYSELEEKYEIFTCLSAENSYSLHLPSISTSFNPIKDKTYIFYIVARGVGSSVGKKLVLGAWRDDVERSENIQTLTKTWSLISSPKIQNSGNSLNLYTHMSNRGANCVEGDIMHIAAFYIYQSN